MREIRPFSELPGDPHFLLSGIRVLFSYFDLLDQSHSQFPGQGVQFQQFPHLLQQLLLILRLLLLSQFSFDLRQPGLQAPFFRQKIPVQFHELPFCQHAGDLVEIKLPEHSAFPAGR